MQGTGSAIARHDFEQVGAEVGNQDVTIRRKSHAVRQGALRQSGLKRLRRIGGRTQGKARVRLLTDELLRTVSRNARHTAARVRSPQGAVTLGKNALGALQVFSDIGDSLPVNRKTI